MHCRSRPTASPGGAARCANSRRMWVPLARTSAATARRSANSWVQKRASYTRICPTTHAGRRVRANERTRTLALRAHVRIPRLHRACRKQHRVLVLLPLNRNPETLNPDFSAESNAKCFGAGYAVQTTVPKVAFSALSAGFSDTCGVATADASLVCWGAKVNPTPTH